MLILFLVCFAGTGSFTLSLLLMGVMAVTLSIVDTAAESFTTYQERMEVAYTNPPAAYESERFRHRGILTISMQEPGKSERTVTRIRLRQPQEQPVRTYRN